MRLSTEAHEALRQHAVDRFPNECCGVIINGIYYPCKNLATTPEQTFKLGGAEVTQLELKHGSVEAVVHSHPYTAITRGKWEPEWPSSHDMESWMKGKVPWCIVATDGEGITAPVWLNDQDRPELLGREFVHGITDCYALIRDYFWFQGVEIPNYARGMEWWMQGQDLYSENFATAGFVEIPADEARIGDVVLMKVASPVINHGGVITGPNEISHHLIHRLSGRDTLSRWRRTIAKYLRHVGTK